ncbi:MAG: hypothetical protein IKU34_09605 [Clostridia bacterium]|nr:hypothetical protein [Clostridia bacterium]
MYGYFRPKASGLTTQERHLFFGYYCRVCYCLRLLGGQTARFLTTHDMAVYSIILSMAMQAERPPYRKCERFLMRTVKEYRGDALGMRLANMSCVVFGEKFRDDELDGNRASAQAMNALFGGVIARARSAEAEMAAIAREGTERINRMQAENAPVYDLFDAYGEMVYQLFACIHPLGAAHGRLIRAIAAWTFYIDMLCDYDKDYRQGAYNGFHAQGIATLRESYAANREMYAQAEMRMAGEMKAALDAADDGASEWTVLRKVIHAALEAAPAFALGTPWEKLSLHAARFAQESCLWRFEDRRG